MNYMGGKHRQGPIIAKFISRVLHESRTYVEPFCGALGVATRVDHSPMILADSSTALINMWKHLLHNLDTTLPDHISEDLYMDLKDRRDPENWLTAYVGFGMSFGAKYFGGYARNRIGTDYAANLKKSVQRKLACLSGKGVELVASDYRELRIPIQATIYCDPPYAGRTRPHDCQDFDHTWFWNWVRDRVAHGHPVLVTEFTIPDDFHILYNFSDTVVRHHSPATKGDGTQEVLVCHESQVGLWSMT